VFTLIKDFDENKDQQVSFGEFVSALWTLEKRDEELDMLQAS
jgi:Ca2+-binding EF-hand superfamily protein